MSKHLMLKNGCIDLVGDEITIIKPNYTRTIPFTDITEINVSSPKFYRKGVIKFMVADDPDSYVPLLKKGTVLTFGISDSIIIARLRYKIEKLSGIQTSEEVNDLQLSIWEKVKLIHPFFAIFAIFAFSFLCLNRLYILGALLAVVTGQLASLAFGGDVEIAGVFFLGVVISGLLTWIVTTLFVSFNVQREYSRLSSESEFDKNSMKM